LWGNTKKEENKRTNILPYDRKGLILALPDIRRPEIVPERKPRNLFSLFRAGIINILKLFFFSIQHSKLCLNGLFVQALNKINKKAEPFGSAFLLFFVNTRPSDEGCSVMPPWQDRRTFYETITY
jgi:hypothetical protein